MYQILRNGLVLGLSDGESFGVRHLEECDTEGGVCAGGCPVPVAGALDGAERVALDLLSAGLDPARAEAARGYMPTADTNPPPVGRPRLPRLRAGLGESWLTPAEWCATEGGILQGSFLVIYPDERLMIEHEVAQIWEWPAGWSVVEV